MDSRNCNKNTLYGAYIVSLFGVVGGVIVFSLSLYVFCTGYYRYRIELRTDANLEFVNPLDDKWWDEAVIFLFTVIGVMIPALMAMGDAMQGEPDCPLSNQADNTACQLINTTDTNLCLFINTTKMIICLSTNGTNLNWTLP